ncbi:MAG: A/G-specific adenine glycosylase [Alistipes sp.]
MSPIAPILLDWYALHGRDLPWRTTRDPYRIWISEVILQQTRVAQGLAYYERFTEHFADVAALAAAPQDEVMKLWQGLGYYSRARNLHAAAQQVVEQFGGAFPSTYAEVRSLRGVGEYTAAAICSAAWNLPYAVVDGNVCRVLARLFDLAEPIDTAAGRKALAELAQSLLDEHHAASYNQAIMDFGATLCTPSQPRCAECPFGVSCLARAMGTVAQRPVKQGRTLVRDRYLNYLHITLGDHTFLHRREGGDIWQGLYEFPMIESPRTMDFVELSATEEFRAWLGAGAWQLMRTTVLPRHQLSHQTLHAVVHQLTIAEASSRLAECRSVPVAEVGDYAVPRLIDCYLSR